MAQLRLLLVAVVCLAIQSCAAPGEAPVREVPCEVPSYWVSFDGAGWRATVVVNGFPIPFQQAVEEEDEEDDDDDVDGAEKFQDMMKEEMSDWRGSRVITWLLSTGENAVHVEAEHVSGEAPMVVTLMRLDPGADKKKKPKHVLKFEFKPGQQVTEAASRKVFSVALPEVKWVIQRAETIDRLTLEDRKEIVKQIRTWHSVFRDRNMKMLKRLCEDSPFTEDASLLSGLRKEQFVKNVEEVFKDLFAPKDYRVFFEDPKQWVFKKYDRGVVVQSRRPFMPILYCGGSEPCDEGTSWMGAAIHEMTFVRVDGKWECVLVVVP